MVENIEEYGDSEVATSGESSDGYKNPWVTASVKSSGECKDSIVAALVENFEEYDDSGIATSGESSDGYKNSGITALAKSFRECKDSVVAAWLENFEKYDDSGIATSGESSDGYESSESDISVESFIPCGSHELANSDEKKFQKDESYKIVAAIFSERRAIMETRRKLAEHQSTLVPSAILEPTCKFPVVDTNNEANIMQSRWLNNGDSNLTAVSHLTAVLTDKVVVSCYEVEYRQEEGKEKVKEWLFLEKDLQETNIASGADKPVSGMKLS